MKTEATTSMPLSVRAPIAHVATIEVTNQAAWTSRTFARSGWLANRLTWPRSGWGSFALTVAKVHEMGLRLTGRRIVDAWFLMTCQPHAWAFLRIV